MAAPTKTNLRAKKNDAVVIINPPIRKPAVGNTNGMLDEKYIEERANFARAVNLASKDPETFRRMYECIWNDL